MATPVSNVYPGSTTYTHEVALRRPNGQVYGLRLKDGAQSVKNIANQNQPPFEQIKQHSFHLGRGWENVLSQQHMGFFDSRNAWTLTPAKLHPTMLMQFAKGLRSQDFLWATTDIIWKKINSTNDPYLDTTFTSTGVTATHLQFYIRRKGNPGTLTIDLCSDSSGDPSTVRQTVSVTKSNVTDMTVEIYDADTSSYAFVASTVYHVLFRSSDTDNNNCWEIGCDPNTNGKRSSNGSAYTATTYAPMFRITDADVAQKWYPFFYDGAMYVVNSLESAGNSDVYINGGRGKATSSTSTTLVDSALNMTADRYIGAYIHIIRGVGAGQTRLITDNDATSFTVATWTVNPTTTSEYVIYGTSWFHKIGITGIDGFTSAAVGAHGLGNVVSAPAVVNNIIYFPQGDSVAMRSAQWNGSTKVHDFQVEAKNAYFVEAGYDPATGPQLWRANNATASGSGGAQTVSRANGTTYGTDAVFRLPNAGATKGIYVGDTSTLITGIKFHEGSLVVHKQDGLFTVSNDRAVERKYGAEDMPSIYNGVAMATNGSVLYISFWTNLMQMAGGTISDTKLWYSYLPSNRVGHVAGLETAFSFSFIAYDAGDGVSSLLLWNNEFQAYHEVLRAFEAGRRIRSVFWQPNEDTNPRLWVEMGGELVFQVFPKSPRPTADTTIPYMPEFVLETSTIDLLNSNSKFFGTLSMVTKNLSQSGSEVYVDYQTDNDVNTSNWLNAGSVVESPEDKIKISAGNKRKIRLRFRANTSDLLSPPIIENYGLSLFEREVSPRYYTIECKTSENQKTKVGGSADHKPTELLKVLEDMHSRAELLTLLSIDPELHNKAVTMYRPPSAQKESYRSQKDWTGDIVVYLFKEAE